MDAAPWTGQIAQTKVGSTYDQQIHSISERSATVVQFALLEASFQRGGQAGDQKICSISERSATGVKFALLGASFQRGGGRHTGAELVQQKHFYDPSMGSVATRDRQSSSRQSGGHTHCTPVAQPAVVSKNEIYASSMTFVPALRQKHIHPHA